jgi:hypothetical protein
MKRNIIFKYEIGNVRDYVAKLYEERAQIIENQENVNVYNTVEKPFTENIRDLSS